MLDQPVAPVVEELLRLEPRSPPLPLPEVANLRVDAADVLADDSQVFSVLVELVQLLEKGLTIGPSGEPAGGLVLRGLGRAVPITDVDITPGDVDPVGRALHLDALAGRPAEGIRGSRVASGGAPGERLLDLLDLFLERKLVPAIDSLGFFDAEEVQLLGKDLPAVLALRHSWPRSYLSQDVSTRLNGSFNNPLPPGCRQP